MSAPVIRIDEILALPYSEDDFKGQEVPVSDNDSWLYDGEDELNSVLQEREKEMEFYNSKKERKQKAKEKQEAGSSSDANVNNFDLGDISKSMQQFINKVSSYKGAETPENRLILSDISRTSLVSFKLSRYCVFFAWLLQGFQRSGYRCRPFHERYRVNAREPRTS